MEKDINKDDAFYMKMNSDLKKQFNMKCLKNKTTMSEVIKKCIQEYLND